MEAKESLVIAIKALVEIGKPILRSTYIDFLVGRQTPEISQEQLDDTEAYGSGESHDEEYWNTLLDKAIEEGYIRIRSAKRNSIEYTASGRSFVRKPKSFQLPDEEEETPELNIPVDDGIDDIVNTALIERRAEKGVSSLKTKQQIKIIQAVDRKMALDDFAETEGIGFDEVLDELEQLIHQGRKIDIQYFTNEVIGAEEMSELLDFFDQDGDDMKRAVQEYGDVYNEEELRLARIVWRSKNH